MCTIKQFVSLRSHYRFCSADDRLDFQRKPEWTLHYLTHKSTTKHLSTSAYKLVHDHSWFSVKWKLPRDCLQTIILTIQLTDRSICLSSSRAQSNMILILGVVAAATAHERRRIWGYLPRGPLITIIFSKWARFHWYKANADWDTSPFFKAASSSN